jgi:transcriptional regulator with GAF, ATPase, and Fis domain
MFTIHLPPLRDRGDDLPMLAGHFIRRFSREQWWPVGGQRKLERIA